MQEWDRKFPNEFTESGKTCTPCGSLQFTTLRDYLFTDSSSVDINLKDTVTL